MNINKTEKPMIDEKIVDGLFNQIEKIIVENKTKMTYQINHTLVNTYFTIGKIIVENEQNGNIRAEYGKDVLKNLSKRLTNKYGTGFSLSGLYNMRLFYIRYKNFQPLAGNLSWSHYCYLIYIEDDRERSFYEKECINSGWSKRELKRQIDSLLFQRLLLSNGKKNIEKVYELSKKGNEISSPTDILKEPYVFEFLGIKEEKPVRESELEKNLIHHLSSFLLELGKGFMYVGHQMRITLDDNTHYYVDLVFYNKVLRSYILIDLKTEKMKPEYVGQMNMYINYYNSEVKDEFDQETIGIILCAGKKDVTMEYVLGGLSNKVFASTYTYYIPNREELINEVERILSENLFN